MNENILKSPNIKSIYFILWVVTLGITSARICAVEGLFDPSLYYAYPHRKWPEVKPERMPTFSSNDRSRWATIRALVENKTFVIGKRIEDRSTPIGYRDEGIVFEPGYQSIDIMMDPQTKQFYSTKPPLFTTLISAEYALLYHLIHWNMKDQRWEVVITILLTFNLLPLALYLWRFQHCLDYFLIKDWSKIYLFSCACFATFLTTFSVTLNNHTPAAFLVLFALEPWIIERMRATDLKSKTNEPGNRISSSVRFSRIFLSAIFAGFLTTLELPALSFACLLGFLWFQIEFRPKILITYLLGFLIPIVLLFAINYQALGDWKLGYSKFGSEWYEYPGSHWAKIKTQQNPSGIDFAREPKWLYSFHLLLGHHGFFSLTPIFFLSLIGIGACIIQVVSKKLHFLRNNPKNSLSIEKERDQEPVITISCWLMGLSLVVFGFYVIKTNNYGGWTSGPRWFFWLTPLFLLAIIPIAEQLEKSSWKRGTALIFLGISTFSVTYPIWNPWRHPWIFQFGEYFGWFKY